MAIRKVTKNVLDVNLEDLGNVNSDDPGSPSEGQILVYNESLGQWQPAQQTTGVTAEDERRFIAYATALGGW